MLSEDAAACKESKKLLGTLALTLGFDETEQLITESQLLQLDGAHVCKRLCRYVPLPERLLFIVRKDLFC